MIPTTVRAFRAIPVARLSQTRPAFNAAKKPKVGIPVELTPLFLATGIAVVSAIFFTSKKLLYDDSLRVGRKNPDQSGLKKVLESES